MEVEEKGLMRLRNAHSKEITEMTFVILPLGTLLLVTFALFRLNTTTTEARETMNSLRKSEEFNRRVLESSQDCIDVLDIEEILLSMLHREAGGIRELLEGYL